MGKKIKIEEWIERAKQIHGNRYDYSKVEYKNCDTPVCIICPEHGEFWQTPYNHVNKKCKCPKCSNVYNFSTNEWIEKARKIHGNKYDYSKVEYKSARENVIVICPEHGEFSIRPDNHNHGQGCPVCRYIKSSNAIRKNVDDFVFECKNIHGDKYDYSKVDYKNNKTKVCIICPEHGEFWQTPDNHLRGKGCPKCSQSKLEEETKEFLNKNNIIFEEQKTFDWLRFKHPMRLDFYLPLYNVAIECQGIQHFKPFEYFGGEDGLKYNVEKDRRKSVLCDENGVSLLYFSNEKYNKLLGKKVYHDLNKILNEIKK